MTLEWLIHVYPYLNQPLLVQRPQGSGITFQLSLAWQNATSSALLPVTWQGQSICNYAREVLWWATFVNYCSPSGEGTHLIEVYEVMRGIAKVNFILSRGRESRTRGHWFKMRGKKFNWNLRGNILTQRAVGIRNDLSEEVVESSTWIG